MNKKLRVGIYLRLSNEDNDKICKIEPSESIKNQRNMLINYIECHDELLLVDEYCDENLSGAGTYRPEFERLINDCKNKKLDVVLCKSQSRFSRDMEIVEKYINNKFIEWNIRFIGLSDNADTKNNGNKKARQINGLVNEWYLEDVSNNIRDALYTKMKQGEFISPFTVFGYQVSPTNNNKIIKDEWASEIIKKIYNLYLKGLGYTSIANYLNQREIPSPSYYKYQKGIKLNIISNKKRKDIKWNPNAIKTILTNEIYIGNLSQGKRTTISYKNHKIRKKKENEWIKVNNTHEAIIDKETFYKVQKEIKERSKVIKNTGVIHPLSGIVYCLKCNKKMRKKNSQKHEYLTCLNCKSIRYDLLEKILLERINNLLKNYINEKEIKKLFEENNKDIIELESKKKEIISKQLDNNNYLKELYKDKLKKLITENQFIELLNDYNIENESYNKQINYIERETNKYKNQNFNDILDKYKQFNKLTRIIVEEFINIIYIDNTNIYIEWNF